jgi:integral membrane sensor domain MASE1
MTSAFPLDDNMDNADDIANLNLQFERMGYFFVPILFVIGLVGNVLTIATMVTQHFWKLTISQILIILAISDILVNILLPFNRPFVRSVLGFDLRSFSEVGCQLFYCAYRFGKMTSSWMVILVAVERYEG